MARTKNSNGKRSVLVTTERPGEQITDDTITGALMVASIVGWFDGEAGAR